MRAFVAFALLVALAFMVADRVLSEEASDLSSLMQTDAGGDLRSHMFLAAFHGYEVSAGGIVALDGMKYEIWPEVRLIQ